MQYRLSSSSSRWMDWLRKLREPVSKSSEKGKTVMLEELELELRSQVSSPNPHCQYLSFLLQPQHLSLLRLFSHF